MKIYLASQSPRRKELLQQIGVEFECISSEIDETALDGEAPETLVKRLALSKAEAGLKLLPSSSNEYLVIGSDTIVVINNEVLGKPKDKVAANSMLQKLSGKQHQVMTAVAVINANKQEVINNINLVSFKQLNQEEILKYCESDEPYDKAGAYGIQGRAAKFIRHLEGSYSGVMGLPLYETSNLLNHYLK